MPSLTRAAEGLFEVCVDSTNKDADGNDTINVMDITTSVWFEERLTWTLVIRCCI